MSTARPSVFVEVLLSFVHLIGANVIKYDFDNMRLHGTIGWEDEEDTQDFEWTPPDQGFNPEGCVRLIEYIASQRLLHGDRFLVSRQSLEQTLARAGWTICDVNSAIDSICSIRIHMIDEGEVSDSFFVHF
ncbi:MAG TPA: hypothetical protein VMW50_14805 [Dehalococcoidia bacterium]|nr:hypothetical protein [Dehalococcoidia bacterium]